MPTVKLPDPVEGEEFTTAHVTAPNEVLARQKLNQGAGILITESATGTTVAAVQSIKFIAKFTAVGTMIGSLVPYAFTEQIPQIDGTWADGPRTGSLAANPAYESNGNTMVMPSTGTARARVYLDPGSGLYMFDYGKCP